MNPSGLQAAVVLPTLADLGCLPLPCASGAAEASDSIGGAEQKKNSNTYLSTESGEVHFVPIGSVTAYLAEVLTGLLGDPSGTGHAEDNARPDDELIIKTLEETGGKEAAESLREIFKHASDPCVRKAARRAIEKIRE